MKAKTKAKEEKVERIGQPGLDLGSNKNEMAVYKVSVKEAPVHGKANDAIIRALAGYFNIARSRIELISGETAKQKIFDIK